MWIVSEDHLFATAIQTALRHAGRSAEVISQLPAQREWDDSDGWVIDLDCLSADLRLPSPVITFARTPRPDADFVRPFLFRALVELADQRFESPLAQNISSLPTKESPEHFLKLLPDGVLLQGKRIPLSPSERTLLSLLLEANGQCVPTERIDALWQGSGSNTTAVYIRYLRKKLDEATGLRLIRCIRGKGYCLCLPS